MTFTIAIVDSNVLAAIGLKQILEDIIPIAEAKIFTSFEELTSQERGSIVHFFVASRIYFEHTKYFREHARKSIVLVNGDLQIMGVKTLNVCQSEKLLVKSILALHHTAHGHPSEMNAAMIKLESKLSHMGEHPQCRGGHPHSVKMQEEQVLSGREIEVAVLLAKGLINKEIADKLNISITTVNTHRTHIMEKLHARSLADVIIHCVMNGYVDVGDL